MFVPLTCALLEYGMGERDRLMIGEVLEEPRQDQMQLSSPMPSTSTLFQLF